MASLAKPGRIKHGLTNTKIYRIWCDMRNRCYNPNNQAYKNYGGRGIVVCEGLRELKYFIEFMGAMPTDKHSIDRINNDDGYKCGFCDECRVKFWPRNVRWADKYMQSMNQRTRSSNYSGVRGVSWSKAHMKWLASINIRGKKVNLGQFDLIVDASRAYDRAAFDYLGDDAILNGL